MAHAGTEYRSVVIKYTGALLGKARLEALRAVARDREAEILYDEVDCQEDGLLSHRLLFWPRDELTTDFTELTVDVSIRQDSAVHLGGYFNETHQHAALGAILPMTWRWARRVALTTKCVVSPERHFVAT